MSIHAEASRLSRRYDVLSYQILNSIFKPQSMPSTHPTLPTPIEDYVLVRVTEAPASVKNNVIVPDSGKAKSNRGIVVNHGPGRFFDNGQLKPMQVAIDDEVQYREHSGEDVVVGDVKHLVLREADIVLIF